MITCFTFDDISRRYLPLPKFRQLLDILNDLKVSSTLFVVPNGLRNHHSKTCEFADCLRTALDLGHELAQHGYEHGGNDYIAEFGCLLPFPFPLYKIQRERMEAGIKKIMSLTGVKPKGFRAPFYLHNVATLKALSNLNFSYDSSKTIFKPSYCSRVRVRVMYNIRPFRIKNVLEIPVTGDYTYNLKSLDFSLKQALKDFKWVKSHNGILVLNNHPNHINLKTLSTFLRIFVEKIRYKTDFMRLSDVECTYRELQ